MPANGQFGDRAYKAFERKEYADQFLEGKIRFRNIYSYRRIEDEIRRDVTEGDSHVVVNGRDTRAMFAGNTPYVYCFSRTLEAVKEGDFGQHIVEVLSPKSLADDIARALTHTEGKFFGGVEGVFVDYTKGDTVDRAPDGLEMTRLIYAQKPQHPFERENEFRLVVISKEHVGDVLWIDIDKRIDDCRLM